MTQNPSSSSSSSSFSLWLQGRGEGRASVVGVGSMGRGWAPVIVGWRSPTNSRGNGVLGVRVWNPFVGVITRGATWGRGRRWPASLALLSSPAASSGVRGIVSGGGRVPQVWIGRGRSSGVASRRISVIFLFTRGVPCITTSSLPPIAARGIVIKLTINSWSGRFFVFVHIWGSTPAILIIIVGRVCAVHLGLNAVCSVKLSGRGVCIPLTRQGRGLLHSDT